MFLFLSPSLSLSHGIFFVSLSLSWIRLADFCGWLNSMGSVSLMHAFVQRQTVCNRTWFGDIGKTYEMEIEKPNALPFVCHLNFTAAGDSHGDIIQVSDQLFCRQTCWNYMFIVWVYVACARKANFFATDVFFLLQLEFISFDRNAPSSIVVLVFIFFCSFVLQAMFIRNHSIVMSRIFFALKSFLSFL